MSILDALILGIVQGLTEFFPVSSSGHLVMTEHVLGLRVPGIFFEIAVHVATLTSVLIVYRQKLLALLRGLVVRGEGSTLPYVGKLVLATIPAVVIGLGFKDWFAARFEEPVFAGTMVLVTGSFVWSTRWGRPGGTTPLWEALPIIIAAGIAALAGTAAPFLAVLAVEPSHDFAAGLGPGAVRARAEALPFRTGSIDVAVSLSSIRHVADRRAALAELRRVVRPGGVCLIVELDPAADRRRVRNHAERLRTAVLRASFRPLVVRTAPPAQAIAALARAAGWSEVELEDDPVQPVYLMRLS